MLRGLIVSVLLLLGVANAITVHLCPHTHDDTGWLKTVDQYYYGANNTIQYAGVQYILDSVVDALAANPSRKFVYVEMAFFARWYYEQSAARKELVKQLVKSEQLQFANGGWCMYDEAAPHYVDMIDETTTGHRFLDHEFGVAPLVGWQVDPFGHSATHAALISAFSGFIATYHGRADYQDYKLRAASKTREFIWQASESLPNAKLLGGVLIGNTYCLSRDFHWGDGDRNQPIMDDTELNDYNVQDRVDKFVALATADANITAGENIMWPLGCDFNYQDALIDYKNMDKLIEYVNRDGRVKAVYSTPTDYSRAKLAEKLTFTTKYDDFFPYSDAPHNVWTGYFTSRPTQKRYVRVQSAFYLASRQMKALANQPNVDLLPRMAKALGVNQHHDGISGTEKQHVAFDYVQRLAVAAIHERQLASTALDALVGYKLQPSEMCPLLNESECLPTSRPGTVSVVVWNGLARERTEILRIPVPTAATTVSGPSDLSYQVYEAPTPTGNYGVNPRAQKFTAAVEVKLPSLGYTSFSVKVSRGSKKNSLHLSKTATSGFSITNGIVEVQFASNGFMSNVKDVKSGLTVSVTQIWCYYISNTGDKASSQPSGAYIFRPNSSTCIPVTNTSITAKIISNGPVEYVVEQRFSNWIVQRIRLPAKKRHFEVEFTVGEIPIEDGKGKEVVSRFITSIQSKSAFRTDSNGREMQLRIRDYRPTWPLDQAEPVAGNYYPIASAASIRDENAQFSVLVDAAVGGGSIADGQLEIMVHRRVLYDDHRGVGEPLNETQFVWPYEDCDDHCGHHYGPGLIVRGTHTVTVLPAAEANATNRFLQDEIFMQPQMFFSAQPINGSLSFLPRPLPPNIQLTTLELLNSTTLLLRLAHQFAVGEDATYSLPTTVDIQNLLIPVFTPVSIVETSLTTNRRISEIRTIQPARVGDSPWIVKISPMEVRTFLVKVHND